MSKYYRYTDRNGLITKDQTHCPSGYFENPRDAIKHMMNIYSETIEITNKKLSVAAHMINSSKIKFWHPVVIKLRPIPATVFPKWLTEKNLLEPFKGIPSPEMLKKELNNE